MAVRKFLARDHRFYISSTGTTGPWTEISGISTWGFAIDSNSEDVSTVDAGAWGSSIHTQRTGTLTLEGFYLVDASDGTRDPGQAAFETAAMQVGFDATRYFKVTFETTSGGEQGHFTVTGTPSISEYGGSVTDVEPFGGEVAVDGAPTGSGVYDIF